ncbi:hypothetical protein AZI86_17065 [Bdellovibrio bacteriovorus]|uniref:Uncharacterized protein n=1 Tax=Bdellovibrio bacteriovorus TaxID=959 RepID=A0A150WEP0_BDEBC|nr:KH domain-containing protein [Bdellovibrio bacteriovorus]KYG61424.1 hypothetical protein AZI86_17065 [Bdellovibrio bacteriovorus]
MGEKVLVVKATGLKNKEENLQVRNDIRNVIKSVLRMILSHSFQVEYEVGERTTKYSIDINQQDCGRLLGSHGRTIGGLRTLVTAMAASAGIRAVVEIKNEERFF